MRGQHGGQLPDRVAHVDLVPNLEIWVRDDLTVDQILTTTPNSDGFGRQPPIQGFTVTSASIRTREIVNRLHNTRKERVNMVPRFAIQVNTCVDIMASRGSKGARVVYRTAIGVLLVCGGILPSVRHVEASGKFPGECPVF
jgi:hypothetical protein